MKYDNNYVDLYKNLIETAGYEYYSRKFDQKRYIKLKLNSVYGKISNNTNWWQPAGSTEEASPWKKRFAFLPVTLSNNTTVWFKFYYRRTVNGRAERGTVFDVLANKG